MSEIKEIRPSEDLAYWVGVAQSDGSLYHCSDGVRIRSKLEFGVSSKSLPMLEKFRDITAVTFDRHLRIRKIRERDVWRLCTQVRRLLSQFRELGIVISPLFFPPFWVLQEFKYFGAYLAGLIDGDGDVRIKRKQYPQCIVRIGTGIWQDFLQKYIETMLKVKVRQSKRYRRKYFKYFGKIVGSSWIEMEFGITKKSQLFISRHVLPHLTLSHKKEKLYYFITKKYAPVGI